MVSDFQDFFFVIRQGTFRTGHAGYAGGNHGVLSGNFVAHQADGFGTRANENETGLFHLIGKAVVFGQKAVAGVDTVGTGYFGSGNQGGDVQIALRRGSRTDADGFVGQFDMQAVFVGFGMYGNGRDAHFAAGTQNA